MIIKSHDNQDSVAERGDTSQIPPCIAKAIKSACLQEETVNFIDVNIPSGFQYFDIWLFAKHRRKREMCSLMKVEVCETQQTEEKR